MAHHIEIFDSMQDQCSALLVVYQNRLSDLLFVIARSVGDNNGNGIEGLTGIDSRL